MLKMTEPMALSIIADVASIASLIITIVVAIQVRWIKRSILVVRRIPGAIQDLEKNTEELRETLKDWPRLDHQSKSALQRIDGILVNFLPKLNGAEKKKLSQPHVLIKRRISVRNRIFPLSEAQRKDAMWEVYYSLLGGIEALKQRDKDNQARV
jgi:hypothetical protein